MADWVIVVDDDVTNLMMAGRILSKNGIRVSALKSGQALLDFVRKNESPDLILLDIRMPGMDGFDTLRRLREQEAGKEEIPVIFLTADETEASEMTGLSLGAMDFIKKPYEMPEIILARVRRIIEFVEDAKAAEQAIIEDLIEGGMPYSEAKEQSCQWPLKDDTPMEIIREYIGYQYELQEMAKRGIDA